MLFKLVALGPRLYVKDKWNIFDGVVVIISVADAVLELKKVKIVKLKNFGPSVFRSLRLVSPRRVIEIEVQLAGYKTRFIDFIIYNNK